MAVNVARAARLAKEKAEEERKKALEDAKKNIKKAEPLNSKPKEEPKVNLMPGIDLSYSKILNGIIYSEILSKPRALRKGRL